MPIATSITTCHLSQATPTAANGEVTGANQQLSRDHGSTAGITHRCKKVPAWLKQPSQTPANTNPYSGTKYANTAAQNESHVTARSDGSQLPCYVSLRCHPSIVASTTPTPCAAWPALSVLEQCNYSLACGQSGCRKLGLEGGVSPSPQGPSSRQCWQQHRVS
jgi:hypothetical protein